MFKLRFRCFHALPELDISYYLGLHPYSFLIDHEKILLFIWLNITRAWNMYTFGEE